GKRAPGGLVDRLRLCAAACRDRVRDNLQAGGGGGYLGQQRAVGGGVGQVKGAIRLEGPARGERGVVSGEDRHAGRNRAPALAIAKGDLARARVKHEMSVRTARRVNVRALLPHPPRIALPRKDAQTLARDLRPCARDLLVRTPVALTERLDGERQPPRPAVRRLEGQHAQRGSVWLAPQIGNRAARVEAEVQRVVCARLRRV